ncbi:DUF962 domain-containing protein [Candidatus Rariloculus sp.]|uniref:Mpo1 family 2-hydroxy fatty acid dioxygenase n=1 Tax=Candidatus Rariloculus sp. TaxID=3101265 RepID=UPI003D0E6C62
MSAADKWLDEYGRNHGHAANKALHWVCVPLIVASLIGLLWSLPVPETFRQSSPVLNWGTLFIMASVVYYFILSLSLAFGILPFLVLVVVIVSRLDGLETPLWLISGVVFALAWAGQFIGHRIEGKPPSFFQDLQYLMIGPLWLLAAVYRRLRIPY